MVLISSFFSRLVILHSIKRRGVLKNEHKMWNNHEGIFSFSLKEIAHSIILISVGNDSKTYGPARIFLSNSKKIIHPTWVSIEFCIFSIHMKRNRNIFTENSQTLQLWHFYEPSNTSKISRNFSEFISFTQDSNSGNLYGSDKPRWFKGELDGLNSVLGEWQAILCLGSKVVLAWVRWENQGWEANTPIHKYV